MRFYSPNTRLKVWFLTVVFRDEKAPLHIRVGDNLVALGGAGSGKVLHSEMECREEHYSVEIYPPGRVFAVVCSPEPGIDPAFIESLAPRDECELHDPRRILLTP